MKKTILLISLLLLWTVPAWAVTLSGTLTSAPGDGLFANPLGGDWDNGGSSITWDVTEAAGIYTYDYTWTGVRKALSHINIQVSDTFTAANILAGTTAGYEFSTSTEANGNPGIPAPLFGLKWETTGDPLSYSMTIVSDRAPMDGNFYANDGGGNDPATAVYAYNTGFDPNSVGNAFIAVPDTTNGGADPQAVIPEPGTIVLVGAGLVGLAFFRKKQAK